MDFGLSDSQSLMQRSIRDFLAKEVPMDRVRRVMESESGHDREILAGLGKLGVAGVLIPETMGGSALRLLDTVVAAQELGRAATPASLHTAWVMAPLLLLAAGTKDQKSRWLPAVASGEALLSMVLGAPTPVDGLLSGSVPFVPDAHAADAFIVHTAEDPDCRLYLLPRGIPGLTTEQLPTVDATRRVGEVRFDDVRLTEEMDSVAAGLVERIVDAARITLAADVLGASQRVLELAVEYSLEREQFGRVIGSFQAVKHMCAETAAEVDPVQSLLWYTAYAWDQEQEEAAHLAPLLKAHATEVGTRAVNTATQVFGGMGFTYECDIHIWFKRAAYDRQMLGGPAELRQRSAAVQFG